MRRHALRRGPAARSAAAVSPAAAALLPMLLAGLLAGAGSVAGAGPSAASPTASPTTSPTASPAAAPPPAQPLPEPPLTCLSAGAGSWRDGALLIEAPITRGIWPGTDGERAGIEVEVIGPTGQQAPAASGRVLQQVGLKLRAQDPCNVLYVMWPAAPATGLRVLVKANEGRSAFAQCGAKGYATLRPDATAGFAPLRAGEPRRLEAFIADRHLSVAIDGHTVWSGAIGAAAAALAGPAGFRTDNLRVQLRAFGLGPIDNALPSPPPASAGATRCLPPPPPPNPAPTPAPR